MKHSSASLFSLSSLCSFMHVVGNLSVCLFVCFNCFWRWKKERQKTFFSPPQNLSRASKLLLFWGQKGGKKKRNVGKQKHSIYFLLVCSDFKLHFFSSHSETIMDSNVQISLFCFVFFSFFFSFSHSIPFFSFFFFNSAMRSSSCETNI